MDITWIGQSGYVLNDGITEICIDPYLSNVVDRIAHRGRMVESPFSPEELKSDIVICTHNHLDHIDIDAIPLMQKTDKLFLAPSDSKEQLEECGVEKYQPFNEGDTYCAGNFKLTAVFADHSVPAIGVIVENKGVTMYFSGDTEYNEKLEELKRYNIDIMFPSNKPTPEQLPEAHRINDLHLAGKDSELPYEGMMLTTVVAEAGRMVRLENAPDAFDMTLSGFRLGPIAFVGIPGEPFNAIGRGLKETERYELIIPCCITNGYQGYFPMQDSYDEGGYEARSSNFKAGVGEYIIKEAKSMLESLR